MPEPTGDGAPAGSPYTAPLSPNSGELGPSRQTNSSPWGTEGSVVRSVHNMSLGRFYCEEYDCGKGFSSEEHLELHMRLFHLTKVSGDSIPPPGKQSPYAPGSAMAAYTNQDVDKPTEANVSQALETGPTIPQFSHSVGHLSLLSIFRTNIQFSCSEVHLGGLRF